MSLGSGVWEVQDQGANSLSSLRGEGSLLGFQESSSYVLMQEKENPGVFPSSYKGTTTLVTLFSFITFSHVLSSNP